MNPQGVARISRLFPGEPIGDVLPRLLEAVVEHAVHGRKDEKYCRYVLPWLRDREEEKS